MRPEFRGRYHAERKLRAARSAVPLLAGVVLAACGADPSPASVEMEGIAMTETTVGGEPVVIAEAKTEPNGRAVLYVHGSGECERSLFEQTPARFGLVEALLNAGYTLASSRANGSAWGTAASVEAHVALAEELKRRGLDVYVLAQSMGGLAGTLLLDRVAPVAWAGIFPVCDATAVADYLDYEIERAYDGAPPRPEVTPVHPGDVAGLPMIFWASPQDTVVPKVDNTDVCAQLAREAGADVAVVTTTGEHGDGSNYDPAGLLGFWR